MLMNAFIVWLPMILYHLACKVIVMLAMGALGEIRAHIHLEPYTYNWYPCAAWLPHRKLHVQFPSSRPSATVKRYGRHIILAFKFLWNYWGIVKRMVNELKDRAKLYQKMVMETIMKVITTQHLGHWWISWDSPCRQYHLFLLGADYYALHWTAGFANQMPHTSSFTWISYYQSLTSGHVSTSAIYNPNAPKGSHWSNVLASSGVVRLQCFSQMHPCWSQGQISTLMSSLMCPISWCILPKYFTQSHAGFCYHHQCSWHPYQAISHTDCPIPLIFTQHLLWVQVPFHTWYCATSFFVAFLTLYMYHTCSIVMDLLRFFFLCFFWPSTYIILFQL